MIENMSLFNRMQKIFKFSDIKMCSHIYKTFRNLIELFYPLHAEYVLT